MAWMRRAWAWAMGAALAVSLGACGGGSDGPPEDPWERLMKVCTKYTEIACAKNAECLPPADPNCMATELNNCLLDGQQRAPTCLPTAANAIEGCGPSLAAMTCADYCTTSADFTVCSAPCFWTCP